MQVLQPFLAPLCLLLLVLVLVQFALIINVNNRLDRQSKAMRTFFSNPAGEDIEQLLRQTLERSEKAHELSKEVGLALEQMTRKVDTCLQHVGLVRYDAYGDVTGQQSFSLVLLDGCGHGAIISALFSRTNSRCYGKIIVEGQPQQLLTDEEQQALILALEQKVGGAR